MGSKISKVIENLRFGNENIKTIKSKVKEIEEIFVKFRIVHKLLHMGASGDLIKDLYEEFMKHYYIKLILKIQQTFENDDNMNNQKECTICLKEFENGNSVTKLKCGHTFCTECIEKWFEESITCPYCRKNFDIDG